MPDDMRQYKNTRTGAVLNTEAKISGGDWVEVTPPEEPEKRSVKKNGGRVRDSRRPADALETSDKR